MISESWQLPAIILLWELNIIVEVIIVMRRHSSMVGEISQNQANHLNQGQVRQ